MDAYDRCTNLGKKIFPILLSSMVEAENFSDHPRILPVWDFMARSRVNVTLYFSIPKFSGGGGGVGIVSDSKEKRKSANN